MKNPNFIDGMRFEDDETGVVFNHFSFCEFIKHIMVAYGNMDLEQANEKVNNSFLAEVPRSMEDVQYLTQELGFHWAMLLTYGDMYWTKGIPSNFNDFKEEYFAWSEEVRQKYDLKRSYEYYDRPNN